MLNKLDYFVQNSTQTITDSISTLLCDFFHEAWKDYDYQLFDKIEQIATKLLVLEKNLIPDSDNNFTFIGTEQEEPSDVVYRILQEAEEPLSIDVIFNKFTGNEFKLDNETYTIIKEKDILAIIDK